MQKLSGQSSATLMASLGSKSQESANAIFLEFTAAEAGMTLLDYFRFVDHCRVLEAGVDHLRALKVFQEVTTPPPTPPESPTAAEKPKEKRPEAPPLEARKLDLRQFVLTLAGLAAIHPRLGSASDVARLITSTEEQRPGVFEAADRSPLRDVFFHPLLIEVVYGCYKTLSRIFCHYSTRDPMKPAPPVTKIKQGAVSMTARSFLRFCRATGIIPKLLVEEEAAELLREMFIDAHSNLDQRLFFDREKITQEAPSPLSRDGSGSPSMTIPTSSALPAEPQMDFCKFVETLVALAVGAPPSVLRSPLDVHKSRLEDVLYRFLNLPSDSGPVSGWVVEDLFRPSSRVPTAREVPPAAVAAQEERERLQMRSRLESMCVGFPPVPPAPSRVLTRPDPKKLVPYVDKIEEYRKQQEAAKEGKKKPKKKKGGGDKGAKGKGKEAGKGKGKAEEEEREIQWNRPTFMPVPQPAAKPSVAPYEEPPRFLWRATQAALAKAAPGLQSSFQLCLLEDFFIPPAAELEEITVLMSSLSAYRLDLAFDKALATLATIWRRWVNSRRDRVTAALMEEGSDQTPTRAKIQSLIGAPPSPQKLLSPSGEAGGPRSTTPGTLLSSPFMPSSPNTPDMPSTDAPAAAAVTTRCEGKGGGAAAEEEAAADAWRDVLRKTEDGDDLELAFLRRDELFFFMMEMASILVGMGMLVDAVRALECATREVDKYPASHPDRALPCSSLGHVSLTAGEVDVATRCYLKARLIRESTTGMDSVDTASTYVNLGVCFAHLKRHRESHAYLDIGTMLLADQLGHDHPRTVAARRNIDLCRRALIPVELEVPHLFYVSVPDYVTAANAPKKKEKGAKGKGKKK